VTWRRLPDMPWGFDPISSANADAGDSVRENSADPPTPSADSG